MKKLMILLLFSCFVTAAFGQSTARLPINRATQQITYTDSVRVLGTSQEILLSRAQRWDSIVATRPRGITPEKARNVVTTVGRDSISYVVSGKSTTIPVRYTAKIMTYNNRYSYEITNFVFEYANDLPAETFLTQVVSAGNDSNARFLASLRAGFDRSISQILNKLKKTMSK